MSATPHRHASTVPRWMIVGEWRAHPVRIATAVVAIAIGVALGFAIHLVNASALDRFARGVATVNGGADLRIEAAGERGFGEELYTRIARLAGVAAASPVVQLHARLGAHPIDLLGIDTLRAGVATPILIPKPRSGQEPTVLFDPGSVFLSNSALAGYRLGDPIALVVDGRLQTFRIEGTIPGAGDGALAIVDIAAAQDRFDRLGRIDRIDLKLAEGADPAKVRATIAAALPADAALTDAAEDGNRTDALSRAYRVNLDMLALVALLTGTFLVYSAQALSIARRRPQFALLRVMGASSRMILSQLVAEGFALGLIGASAGILAGFGIAAAVLRVVGGDLGSGQFGGEGRPTLLFDPKAAIAFAVLGLVAALVGSLIPTRQVALVSASVSLRNPDDAIDPRRRPAIRTALLLAVVGVGFALMPAIHGMALFGYASVGLLLAAGIAAMPWLARVLLAPLAQRRFASPVADLAVGRLWGAPAQAAVALSGIVASVGLMIAMAVMVSSFRSSVDDWLGQILSADLYLSADGGTPFDVAAQRRLAGVPGVAHIDFGAQHGISLSPDRPPVLLFVRDGEMPPALGREVTAPPRALAVRVSEPAARLYHLTPGSTVALPLGAHRQRAFVTAVYQDYARQAGAITIDGAAYDRLTGDTARGEAAITLAAGADVAATLRRLRGAITPNLTEVVQIVPTRALREHALAIFDRSFAITYGLELVAVLVGLAGVAATTSAQTIARTREFGMLRHLGVTRRQVVAMLGLEGSLLGLVGGIAGIALGCGLAQILIRVVNPQSFNWTMETRLPIGLLACVGLALVTASAVTAMLAGRRAVSSDAVRAVREDW